jgi:Zn-dependent protease/CBS domain-containing protein
MKWSWKAGQIAGIDLRIHATFLLLLGWVGLSYWIAIRNIAEMATAIGFIVAIFGCVLLHELGHALMARRFGIRTHDITLLPIGGVARLERMPEQPKQELWIALAGPAVNFVIAWLLELWLNTHHEWMPLGKAQVTAGPFAERLLIANIWLAVFNLVPAFPMDGGRVLRALLAYRMSYPRATQIAATVGQGLAFVLGFAGLFSNPMLLFIAFFVWIGATQEVGVVSAKPALSGTTASEAMITDFASLGIRDTLSRAVELSLKRSQPVFPVISEGFPIGVLGKADLLVALSEHGESYPVSAAMRLDFPVVEPCEMLDRVLERLREGDDAALVVEEGRVAGVITRENLRDYLLIGETLRRAA